MSTNFCSSWMPASASRMRCVPSKWKGLVTTPTVRMPASRAARAMTGAAPVPVPPPMPAVMNTMLEPSSACMISSSASSAAMRPISGREPAPRPRVTPTPSWMRRSASDCFIACASVLQTMNSQPLRPERIMLLTALPPAPPTPTTVMRGFSSCSSSGMLRLKVMLSSDRCSAFDAACPSRRRGAVFLLLEVLTDPMAEPADEAVRLLRQRAALPRDLGAFGKGEMDEPGRRGEGRAAGRLGEACDAQRPADANLLVENERRQLARAREAGTRRRSARCGGRRSCRSPRLRGGRAPARRSPRGAAR